MMFRGPLCFRWICYYLLSVLVFLAIVWCNVINLTTDHTYSTTVRTSAIGGEIDVWNRVRDFLRAHNCAHAYIDVGSNIGVQIRKLYEPHKYQGIDPSMKALAERFGLLEEPTDVESEAGLVKGHAFWNNTSEVLPIFDEYFGPAPRCGVCAIGVEPNPKHTHRLIDLQSRLRAAGAPVLWLHETAADVADGFTTLNLKAGGGMVVNDVGMTVKAVSQTLLPSIKHDVVVTTIDLSRLILMVRAELGSKSSSLTRLSQSTGSASRRKSKLVMKLDIEGGEYHVVPHLLARDILCDLDLVFLEWHETEKRAEELNNLRTHIDRVRKKCETVVSPIDDETFLYDGKDFPTASVCYET